MARITPGGGGGSAAVSAAVPSPMQVFLPGVAAVATNVLPPGLRVPADTVISQVYLRAGTAPSGSGLTVAVRRNGQPFQNVTLTAGQAFVSATGLGLAVYGGDVLTFDVTAVGSTTPGADLAIDLLAGGTAETFLNTTIPGLFARYRASKLGLADGAAINSWADVSGAGRTLTPAAGKAPTLLAAGPNGKAAVRFDNTTATKAVTGSFASTLAQPLTVVAVARGNGDVNLVGHEVFAGPGLEAKGYIKFNKLNMNAGSTVSANPALTTQTWYGLLAGFNGATSRHGIAGAGTTTMSTVNPGTNGLSSLTVGASSTATGYTVDIAEVLVYDHLLTDPEFTIVRQYLTAEYGIGT